MQKLIVSGEVTVSSVDGDGRSKLLMSIVQEYETVVAIDFFARWQVSDALARLKSQDHGILLEGRRSTLIYFMGATPA